MPFGFTLSCFIISVWINQNKQSTNTYKFWFKEKSYIKIFLLFTISVWYSFQYTNLGNLFLTSFDTFLLPFGIFTTAGTFNFVSLIVKITFLGLVSSASLSSVNKAQCYVYLSSYLTEQFRMIFKNYLNILIAQQMLHLLEFHLRNLPLCSLII